MRVSYRWKWGIGLMMTMVPAAAFAGGDVRLQDVSYESWSHPKQGDALPVGGPVIRVYSEGGERFDFVGHTNQPVRFWGQLSGSCGKVYKISYVQFKVAGTTAPVSHPSGRGAWFSRYGSVDVPHDNLQFFDAVGACNDQLKTLAAETGQSRRDLIAGGFGIHFPGRIEALGSLVCSGNIKGDSDTTMLDLWVDCVGNPKSAEPEKPTMKTVPAKLSPFVSGLTFDVDRPNWVGKCPVSLKFTGSITTSRAGTVKYRSVAQDGSSSPTYSLSFGAAGTKEIGTWSETLAKPKASDTLAAGPELKGPDFSGWRRLEIVEPAGFAPSSAADYTVTCQEQTMQLQAAPVATPKPARIKQ